jgi:hypothetical protein
VCGYCQEVRANYGTQFLPQSAAAAAELCSAAGPATSSIFGPGTEPAPAAKPQGQPKPAPLARKLGGGGGGGVVALRASAAGSQQQQQAAAPLAATPTGAPCTPHPLHLASQHTPLPPPALTACSHNRPQSRSSCTPSCIP